MKTNHNKEIRNSNGEGIGLAKFSLDPIVCRWDDKGLTDASWAKLCRKKEKRIQNIYLHGSRVAETTDPYCSCIL